MTTPPLDPAYLPPPVPTSSAKGNDPHLTPIPAILVSEWTRDRLAMISAGSPRSRQAALGPSEIGAECPRQVAYRIAGTPVVNLPDPLRAMFGTGLHEVIAAGLAQLDPGRGRYLIEQAVAYRGIVGHIDLLDRLSHRMIDWKTTTKDRIRRYRTGGIPSSYLVQAQTYAAGLAELGERVETIALVFIPRDGLLSDVWSWTTTPDRAIADAAIDRYEAIAEQVARGGPAEVNAVPTNLCGYCSNYRPNQPQHHADLSVACPGKERT